MCTDGLINHRTRVRGCGNTRSIGMVDVTEIDPKASRDRALKSIESRC